MASSSETGRDDKRQVTHAYVPSPDAISLAFPHLAIMSPADTIRRGQDVVDDLRSDLADGAEPYLPGGADTTMLAAWDALLAERERDKATIHKLEVKLTGYDEFRAAQTEANDGDDIWEFYSRKTWASLLRWKEQALSAEAERKRDKERIARLRDENEGLVQQVNRGRASREVYEGLPEGTLPRVAVLADEEEGNG